MALATVPLGIGFSSGPVAPPAAGAIHDSLRSVEWYWTSAFASLMRIDCTRQTGFSPVLSCAVPRCMSFTLPTKMSLAALRDAAVREATSSVRTLNTSPEAE